MTVIIGIDAEWQAAKSLTPFCPTSGLGLMAIGNGLTCIFLIVLHQNM